MIYPPYLKHLDRYASCEEECKLIFRNKINFSSEQSLDEKEFAVACEDKLSNILSFIKYLKPLK